MQSLAAAEGLRLVPSDSVSGFKGVAIKQAYKNQPVPGKRCFIAHALGAERQYLGVFFTAEEAALAIARHEGAAGCEAAIARRATLATQTREKEMSADEALAAARAEGLTLPCTVARGHSAKPWPHGCGDVRYQGVHYRPFRASRPFEAVFDQPATGPPPAKAKRKFLGAYATAQQAALALARHRALCRE